MPDQIKRLLVVIASLVVLFLVVRNFFIPESFGKFGHYRAAALDTVAALPLSYAGHNACLDCHDDIDKVKSASYHRGVNCEACHGPGHAHIESMGDSVLTAPRDRDYCVLCHGYSSAKPTGFPQIDPITHNPVRPCITCHHPHAPDPPRIPGDCSACHAVIARTKAVSPHALLECIQCHLTPEEHKINPRMVKPGKPVTRNDCGVCHAQAAESDKSIPRVDIVKHGDGFICWNCHYPHNPESKKR